MSKRERIKTAPLKRHPDHLPFYIKLESKLIKNIHNEAKKVFDFMLKHEEFHVDTCTYAPNKKTWKIIEENFPLIKDFYNNFKMTKKMIFLEFNVENHSYKHRPHTHNTETGTGLFLTIKHSEGAGTAFYKPKQENVFCMRYTLDSGVVFEAEDCVDTKPTEIVQMIDPHVIALNAFHSPIEILEGHPDNKTRVTMNWASEMNFEDFARKVNQCT